MTGLVWLANSDKWLVFLDVSLRIPFVFRLHQGPVLLHHLQQHRLLLKEQQLVRRKLNYEKNDQFFFGKILRNN